MTTLGVDTLCRTLSGWNNLASSVGQSLEEAFIHAIEAGFIPTGSTLPPQRELSKSLAVGRGTLQAALKNLENRGYLEIVQGSGARVRSARARSSYHGSGRLFSLTNAPAQYIDLTSGALPASPVMSRMGLPKIPEISDYLETDGYFPAGIPVLRHKIAEYLSSQGIPTEANQILVTNGAQQATMLSTRMTLSRGESVLVEDPTYRGALEIFAVRGVQTIALSRDTQGISPSELANKSKYSRVLYCQTSVHNPTGLVTGTRRRTQLAEISKANNLTVIEDCCSFDLTKSVSPAGTLAPMLRPDQLIQVGTLSKLFWGGLRIGWLRSTPETIRLLSECRKTEDLATPVIDQLLAAQLLDRAHEALEQRRRQLRKQYESVSECIFEAFPEWKIHQWAGGTTLWIDTGGKSSMLIAKAREAGVALSGGPTFSPTNSYETFIKFPIWRDIDTVKSALQRIREVC
ncbi:GntR family transcriptional regulator [Trueperella pyogenes]|uniref:PLP-dependent aminotransferase family protein n=1 Tax=Trueperella pyogenes TaxID=1661 RepID=A0ABV3NB32_9ACTO|nr:PLP-dependent aminotransferase family protein [Trueperella pyogenes]AHU90132.1 GntR family transcriptional regulator [Trueperella pyogenes]OQD32629.1 hypothetical protein B1R42_09720 [Trueperella pyogenes]